MPTESQLPWVHFEEPGEIFEAKPPRLVVESPKKPVALPQDPQLKPKLILKEPKYIVEHNYIASRTCSRQKAQADLRASIASRVASRRRGTANSVLDQETGKLLEYRQLLNHPRFQNVWNRSAADEFGRLAQGIGNGRVKATDTIRFIHKHQRCHKTDSRM